MYVFFFVSRYVLTRVKNILNNSYGRCEVLTEVKMWIVVFWVDTV
jgi:hypothetical protein